MASKTFGTAGSYLLKTASGGNFSFTTATQLVANVYDNGDGTTSTVTSNRWSNRYLYAYPGSNVLLSVMGRADYGTSAAAQAAITTETKTDHPVLNEGILL